MIRYFKNKFIRGVCLSFISILALQIGAVEVGAAFQPINIEETTSDLSEIAYFRISTFRQSTRKFSSKLVIRSISRTLLDLFASRFINFVDASSGLGVSISIEYRNLPLTI